MFTEISKIIQLSNLSRLNLVVVPSETGNMTVMIYSDTQQGDAQSPELQRFLSQPQVLKGTPEELDEEFGTHFKKFVSTRNVNFTANTSDILEQSEKFETGNNESIEPVQSNINDEESSL